MFIFFCLTFLLLIVFPFVSYKLGHVEYFLNYGIFSSVTVLALYLLIDLIKISGLNYNNQQK